LNLRFVLAAELEALDAAHWYDDQRAGLGEQFSDELGEAVRRIAAVPQSFAKLEAYDGRHDLRRCLLSRFPYLVIFQCCENEIVVVAVSHVRREPFYWINRLE
jgi:hypothetical protein